jgi:serine protease Do
MTMRHVRRGALIVVLFTLAVGTVVVPRLGSTAAPSPLWSERALPAGVPVATSVWVNLAAELKPAVVNISTKRVESGRQSKAPGQGQDPFDFFRQFRSPGTPRTVRSLGSGFVINSDGYLVTNNHVIDGATEVKARFGDGRELAATILGRDPKTDLALLKVDAHGLPAIPLGDSSQLKVGEPVMAIGNPFGLEQTVTTGIVSATGRVIGEGPYDDYIQTDASINPGNSGGPLINSRGQAIGINAAIYSASGGSVGIGFAIPVNLAKGVVTQLAASGHVVRGWLGVGIQRVTPELASSFGLPESHGALVSGVSSNSPAMQAGLKAGDVIVEYDGRKVATADELPRAVADTRVGRQVPIVVVRDGKQVRLTATIVKLADAADTPVAVDTGAPKLGLTVETLTPALAQQLGIRDRDGVLVSGVEDGSPAANAGLRAGDVIAEINRRPAKSVNDLARAVKERRSGEPLLVLVHREGGALYLTISA